MTKFMQCGVKKTITARKSSALKEIMMWSSKKQPEPEYFNQKRALKGPLLPPSVEKEKLRVQGSGFNIDLCWPL